MRAPLIALAVLAGAPALAATQQEPPTPAPRAAMEDIARQVDPAALRLTIERLVAFGTRQTLSDTTSPTRGIGAARRWVASKFAEDSARCGGSLTIETPQDAVTGARIPKPAVV
jgi:hypothetical protein